MFDCIFDIDVDGNRQMQRIQAPRIMIEQQFVQLLQGAVNDNRAVKIMLKRDAPCYDSWHDRHFTQEHSIEFKNRAYVDNEEKS